MNIIYIGAFRMPNFDAAAARVLNNAKAFRAAGCSVSFISWGGGYNKSDLCADGKYRVHGFEYLITNEIDCNEGFIPKLRHRLVRGNKSLQILKEIQNTTNVIILYNAEFSWTLRIMRFCKRNKIKLVHDITEWFSNKEIHFTDIIPNYLNMTLLQKQIPNKILISSYLNNYYSQSNNIILPPLCDIFDSKWNKEFNDNSVESFNGITFIYAGSPLKKDYLYIVINAVNRLLLEGENIRLLILGVSKEEYNYKITNIDSIHDNIRFLGRVSQDIVPSYYKQADFSILIRKPSRKSNAGFPTKVAESITAGIPVITNNTSDLKKYIIESRTGFIVNGYDEDSLVCCIKEKVLNLSQKLINEMKMNTKQMCKYFDYKSYITNIISFLEKLR